MKKFSLLATSLITLLLVGCANTNNPSESESNNDEVEEIIDTALGSLKYHNHDVLISETVSIKKPNDSYAVDIFQSYEFDYGYYYDGENKAHRTKTHGLFADLDKVTGEIVESTKRETYSLEYLYHKNIEDGTTFFDEINIYNEVTRYIAANQDSNTGAYMPIIYDDEFKNPFDYITTRDLTYNKESHTISLSVDKANFVIDCYSLIGMNLVNSATLILNESNYITAIEFDIAQEVNETYSRINTLEITYRNHDTAKLYYVEAYTHDNPALAAALKEHEGLTNYTYNKDYHYGEEVFDHIEGYFTQDGIYFHHGQKTDTTPYVIGDNYDYKVMPKSADMWQVYEFTANDAGEWTWKEVWASPSQPYYLPSFEACGPSYFDISPAIFKNIGNNQYEVEEQLRPTIGQYFDYEVWGVDSYVLESSTNKCVITLNDDGSLKQIDIGFNFQSTQTYITYYYTDIGTTKLPTYINDTYIGS